MDFAKIRREEGPLFVKQNGDLPFFVMTLILLAFGLVMLLSSSYVYAFYNTKENDSLYFFKRQLVFAISGIVMLFLVSHINYRWYRRFATIGLIASWGLLAICIFWPSEDEIKRFIYIGSFSFQPSEIAKIMIIFFCANKLDQNHQKMISTEVADAKWARRLREKTHIKLTQGTVTMFGYAIVILFTVGLVFAGSHLSGAILIMLIGASMLWMGEGRARWFGIAIIAIGLVVAFAVTDYEHLSVLGLKEYQIDRVRAWLDKDFDPQGQRWQINHSLYAFGSGGVLGEGFGNSKQKYLYIPESHTDFIFSIIGEELGFIGCLLLLVAFALLILRGVYIGLHASDRFGSLLAFGMVAQLGWQVVLNVAVVADIVPNTGIGLPFFSYGGTALWITLMEMGVVLSVSAQANMPRVYSLKPKKRRAARKAGEEAA